MTSLHRRPLPAALIPFSSEPGRALFREALESGHLEAFFPLIEQFHTQSDPAFCGLGSLVMVLNALGVDPGRVWRGPWRWFSEELLDCCTPLSKVRVAGVTLDEVACLARCNGAEVELGSPARHGLEHFRAAVDGATRAASPLLIASYSREVLGQTGAGHFSPIGGYHAASDAVLVLDVARFKYPPHWVPLPVLFEAMRAEDAATGRARGWLTLRKRAFASAISRFLVCSDGIATRAVLQRVLELQGSSLLARPPANVDELLTLSAAALGASGISERVRLRPPETAEQQRAFDELMALIESTALHRRASARLGPALATRVAAWWLAAPRAAWADLPAPLRDQLAPLLDIAALPPLLAAEIELLRSQVDFLLEVDSWRDVDPRLAMDSRPELDSGLEAALP
jgi:glutathione gamma-glutamylcysteinyltransferase